MNTEELLMVEAYSKLPTFKLRINKALDIIREGLGKGTAYVAVSWGKDSVVLLHLVQSIEPNIQAIYHAHIERDLISNYSQTIEAYTSKFPTNLSIQETWDASGKKQELERLLSQCLYLGKKRSYGNGQVNAWEVIPTEKDYHLFKDGKLMRPMPYSLIAPFLDLKVKYDLLHWGWKPPVFLPQNQALCAVP